ncbi:MAG: ATP-binding protein [Campylobacterota bacterium]
MKNIFILFIFFPIYLFANSSILIINSYHKGYEWSDDIVNGLEKVFYTKKDIELNILYMDSKRITSKEYYESLKKLYKVQLQNRKYDLVITLDRFAYDFIVEEYEQFFTDEKILTVGIENFNKKRLVKYDLENKVWALLEKRDLKGNLRLIEKLNPLVKKVYVINDNSLNAQHTQPLIDELFRTFDKSYELIYLKEDSLKELKSKLENKALNSVALFIRFYKDSLGNLYKNNQIAEVIKESKLPIFVTDSIFLADKAVGGKIVDLNDFGEKAGFLAVDLLNNKEVKKVNIYKDLQIVLDEKKINQFYLDIRNLKQRYKLINKEMTFFDRNRAFIDSVFLFSPLLVIFIILLLRNISLRRKIQYKLKQRIELDSLLLNAIESPIFWVDETSTIIDSNIRFCNLLGYSCEKIHGKKLEELKKDYKTNTLLKALEKFHKNPDKNTTFKLRVNSKEIKVFFIKQASYCDTKTKKSGTVTILTDITKEKKETKEKEKSRQFIIQQSKLAEIGEIFSSIAHQWKAPLVEITTIAQESFYNSNSNESENESYVKDIMVQVDYMNRTINDFQNFIKPSQTKSIFNAKTAFEDMLEIVEHNIKYNYISIDLKVKEGTNLSIYGYRNEFMQAVLNIINNAKDELIKEKIENKRINIEFYSKENFLVIEILDNAKGIKIKNIKKIFKPYYTTKSNGHGIGLYMVKTIIENKMNGKIKVENSKIGAKFKIYLKSM